MKMHLYNVKSFHKAVFVFHLLTTFAVADPSKDGKTEGKRQAVSLHSIFIYFSIIFCTFL